MTIRTWMTGALAGAALLTAAASASAQDCETNADCGEGLSCVLYSETNCTSAPPCEDGFDCPDMEYPDDCVEEEYGYCQPVPVDCTADSDCEGDFVCVSFTYESCDDVDVPAPMPAPEPGGSDGAGGDRGSDDEPGAEEEPGDRDLPAPPNDDECEEVTEAYCVPPYVAPCDSDAACGAGFECVEVEMCECSGGGSTGSGGGDVPPNPGTDPDEGGEDSGDRDEAGAPEAPDAEEDPAFEPDVDCSCSGTGDFYCEPEEVSCESSADCVDGWSCEEAGDTVCTFDATTGEEFCEESESYCFPPNWDVWGGAAGGGSDDALGYPTAERAGGGEVENADEESNDPTDAGRRAIDEGCVAAAAPAAGSWALMLLGMLGLRRRRR